MKNHSSSGDFNTGTTIFEPFFDAAKINADNESFFAQYNTAYEDYCMIMDTFLPVLLGTIPGDSQHEIAHSRITEAKNAFEPHSRQEKDIKDYFTPLNERAEDLFVERHIIATILKAPRNMQNPKQVSTSRRTARIMMGRVVGASPRYNELGVIPVSTRILGRPEVAGIPVVRRNDEGTFVPAMRVHYLGKRLPPKVVKEVEAWDDLA